LNTPRLATNSSGTVVWRWDSDAFGIGAANQDPDSDSNLVNIRLRFPGQYLDEETGLHYNYFRDYDPVTGRYVQSDPIGLAGGPNTHVYADANPLVAVDPLGLQGRTSALAQAVRVALEPAPGGPFTQAGAALRVPYVISQIQRVNPSYQYRSYSAFNASDVTAVERDLAYWQRQGTCLAPSVPGGSTYVTTPSGTIVPVPGGWTPRSADNGRGIVYQRPGAAGNADMMRIMEPTARYPSGYLRYYNQYGQPLDALGKPGPRDATHIPLDYEGSIPGLPK